MLSDLFRILFGTVSDRPGAVNDVSAFFGEILSYFGVSFFVAGAKFCDVGG